MTLFRYWTKPGDWVLVLLVLLPLAVASPRLAARLDDTPGGWLSMLAAATGILGLSMMLLAGALSVRLPRFDRFFGGLTRLWQVHHLLGFGGLLLVLAHVLLLAFAALPASLQAAVQTLFPPLSNWAVWTGWFALAALLIFLAPSFKFFGLPHYQRWKTIHMVFAPAALVLALAHALPLSPQTASWWLLAAFAIGAIIWRKVGSRLAARRAYTITAVDSLASDVVELSLRPDGSAITYAPGQFVYLTPTDPSLKAGRGEEHPYTIASGPQEELLRIGIKDLGDATHALQSINPRTRVWVEGPYGTFFERLFPQRGQLWLGGGIGITPFVSGVRAIRHRGTGRGGVHLFYLADEPRRAYYLEELLAAAADTEGLDVTAHYFQEEGPVTTDFLAKYCPDFAEREIYICGPPPMLTHLRALLRRQHVPSARIHTEEFNFL